MAEDFNPEAVAATLRQCTTSGEIHRLRKSLTREQALEVGKKLTPLERSCVLLALAFGGDGKPTGRWQDNSYCEAFIVSTLDEPNTETSDGTDREGSPDRAAPGNPG
jgi:hypothetical protein